MVENLCESCRAACCKGPITMSLSAAEHQIMVDAGTELVTIAEPTDYSREDVSYPVGFEIDPEKPDRISMLVEKGREYEPLVAGLGRYIMLGTCGNLKTINGWEQCSIYDNRPQVCQDFETAGETCHPLRQMIGVDPPS